MDKLNLQHHKLGAKYYIPKTEEELKKERASLEAQSRLQRDALTKKEENNATKEISK